MASNAFCGVDGLPAARTPLGPLLGNVALEPAFRISDPMAVGAAPQASTIIFELGQFGLASLAFLSAMERLDLAVLNPLQGILKSNGSRSY